MHIDQLTRKTTHQLQVGDRVSYYGVIFELVEKRHSVGHSPNCGSFGPSSVVYFETIPVAFEERSRITQDLAKDWCLQGNDLANWWVVNE